MNASKEHGSRFSLLVLTPNLSENSLGRAYVFWLLGKQLDWRVNIVSVKGDEIWEPLAKSEFAQDCLPRINHKSKNIQISSLVRISESFDAILAIKALPHSFGLALSVVKCSKTPLYVDYDDPDLEIWSPRFVSLPRLIVRYIRHPLVASKMISMTCKWTKFDKNMVFVSNPILQNRHGGTVIPHVREPLQESLPAHIRIDPVIVFVGTTRKHKGISILREAVARLEMEGFVLVITDNPPPDAHVNEQWVGKVSMETGLSLVRDGDIVVLPSLQTPFAQGQLPAKLIDAMFAGRAVIASDVGPIPWALGDTGIIVTPGDIEALVRALRLLQAPAERERLGRLAQKRANELFSVSASLSKFKQVFRI